MNITLFGKKVLANIIKDFEMRRLSWFIRVSPKCHRKCPHQTKAEGALRYAQRRQCEDGGRYRSDVATNQETSRIAGSHQKLEEARKGFSPRASEGNIVLPTPWFSNFQPPEL